MTHMSIMIASLIATITIILDCSICNSISIVMVYDIWQA